MNHEFQYITQLFQSRTPFSQPHTTLANGDDASVHHIPLGQELVISTDSSIAGVHWPENYPLHLAADRAIGAALSDLAAMGAEANWVWLAITAADRQSLQQMSDGVVEACLRYHVELAGGDTTRAPRSQRLNSLHVTVGGLVNQHQSMTRSNAKPGDDIWLAGHLGLSAAGLSQWLDGETQGDFTVYFSSIQPQLDMGIQLRNAGVCCCIDVSDGLLQDAGHISESSHIHLRFDWEKLQQLPAYQILKQHYDEATTQQWMLRGGEDYALLLTAPKSLRQQLTSLNLCRVGTCTSGQAVSIVHQGQPLLIATHGFDHFA